MPGLPRAKAVFPTTLLLAVWAGSLPCAAGAWAADSSPIAIQNELVRVALDDQGRLSELTNLRTHWNYAGQARLWRIFYRTGDRLDAEALAPAGKPKIAADGPTLKVRFDRLQSTDHKPLDISLELRAALRPASDDVSWSASVENRQPGIVITEVQFPLVGNCQLRPGHALITSALGGQRFEQPKAAVRARHTRYMAPDQNGIKMSGMYPGITAATNCFVFADRDQGLYCGSHDPSLQSTLHLFRLLGDELEAGFVKYPFLATGEKFTSAEFVLAPYSGNWHLASKKYRTWANGWFAPPRPPDWVRRMSGWQRIILKHQYGEVLHPYNTIPQMARDGASAGIHSILLFGWWNGGMDAAYPNYAFDEAQGGRAVLAAQIQAAQRQGARVHLYFNGRLIDKESEFYRSGEASRVSIKDLRGNEVNESYHFSGNGTTAWQFGRKTFAIACPASKAWQQRRLAWCDLALSLGVDSVFFDQLGINEAPCTDSRHGHPVPLVSAGRIHSDALREIRQHIKARNPNAAFGTEILCDVAAAQADYMHGLTGGTKPPAFLEWFRYTFPEVIFSDREIRDDTDIQRRVNLNLVRGLRSDVELYRCRGTIADAPTYREYLGQVNALRDRYPEFFWEGLYRDTDFCTLDTADATARSFQSGDRLLVAVTQSHRPEVTARLSVPGYRLVKTDGLGQYRVEPKQTALAVTLKQYAVALAVFEKL